MHKKFINVNTQNRNTHYNIIFHAIWQCGGVTYGDKQRNITQIGNVDGVGSSMYYTKCTYNKYTTSVAILFLTADDGLQT